MTYEKKIAFGQMRVLRHARFLDFTD